MFTSTHATTKFKWKYKRKDGNYIEGAFVVPIGEEYLASDWVKRIIKSEIDEEYIPSMTNLEEIGDEKIR